jgi:hypothetical protein
MKLVPVIVALPTALLREIGRVIVSFANLEHRLSVFTWVIMKIPPEVGRLAAREPRVPDRFNIISDLLELHKTPLKEDEARTLRTALEAVTTQRDQLAHGVWLKEPTTGRLFLRVTKGSWQPVSGQRGKTKRAIMPESVEYDVDDARSLRLLIDELRETIDRIATTYETARDQASREKSPLPHQQNNQPRDRSAKAHSARRRSSPP